MRQPISHFHFFPACDVLQNDPSSDLCLKGTGLRHRSDEGSRCKGTGQMRGQDVLISLPNEMTTSKGTGQIRQERNENDLLVGA